MTLRYGFLIAAAAAGLQPAAAAATPLAPHRAVYDLALSPGGDVAEDIGGMSGRMVFEFTGDPCEGYTVNFRFVMESRDGDGRPTVTDLRTSSFEGGDGREFRFLAQTFTNQVLTEEVKGTAERADGSLVVDLVEPADKEVRFDQDAIFPTDHLIRIIAAAESGPTILQQQVFDGSEQGDRIYRTTTVIGPARGGEPGPEERAIGDLRRWPVSVAYFNESGTGDQTPEYTIAFDLWENGVSTDLTMDYGDFALTGTLSEYEALGPAGCR